MTKAYQSDVKLLSDEELESLSAELEEAYCRADEDGCAYWMDDEAEDRYIQMDREIERRRWEALTPEQQAKEEAARAEFMRTWPGLILKQLESSMVMASRINLDFDGAFSGKIGDTIHVRKPPRYLGGDSVLSELKMSEHQRYPDAEPTGTMVED